MIETVEAEFNILGCAMFSPDACDDAFERLRPEHFSDALNARLWACMIDLRRAGQVVELFAIKTRMASDLDLIGRGGVQHLADLFDKAYLAPLQSHVDAVIDGSGRRAIHQLAANTQAQAVDTSQGSAESVLTALEAGAAEIARHGAKRAHARTVGLGALETIEGAWRGEFKGVPTGLDCLDYVTGGIRQDDVWFIGGRTSMGKSVLGLALAKGIARQNRGVIMFSLEMSLRECQARMIADLAYEREDRYSGGNVQYGDLLKGRGTNEQRDRARQAARDLASLPMSVDDRGGLTIDDIRSQAQRQFRAWDKAGLPRGALVVDHIGLVKPARKTDSKAADTADTVNELKDLAKQLGAPIIALCQVNRQTENRTDKRPQLSDLNWSGSIEQIADFIGLLYRDAYYEERAGKVPERPFDLEILIHKNRAGPVCTVHAHCDVRSNAVRDQDDSERAMRR